MTHYNVHLYREVRLTYESIEADTAHAAAATALDKSVGAADDIDDCDGEVFAALVDVAGDQQHDQSVTIDFEAERLRQAAPELLAAIEALLPFAENEESSLYECWKRNADGEYDESLTACAAALNSARAAIAKATAQRRLS
jgi:hypothetical protein